MAQAVANATVFTGEGFEVKEDAYGVNHLWLKMSLESPTVYDFADILPAIHERILSEKMPAGVLSKELGRIALHVQQAQDAIATLFSTYSRMVGDSKKVSGKRMSSAYKARFSLLGMMDKKSLRDLAVRYIPEDVDNYILSDSNEREALMHRLCVILADDKSGAEEEDSSTEE